MNTNFTLIVVDEEPPDPNEAVLLGGRYKRLTKSTAPRPYTPTKKGDELGDAAEMEAVFEARRQWRAENPHDETIREIEADTRNLCRVLSDFPGLLNFIVEVNTYRRQSVDRLELIKRLRRQLEKVAGRDAGLQAQIQIDKAIEEETGFVTVAALRREFGYSANTGVGKHIRALSREKDDAGNWLIKDSSARKFNRHETSIIRVRLSKLAREKRANPIKNQG